MKASRFGYARPRSLEEALALLAENGEQAKIIAGGQSLVPALNLRLVAPSLLVDIGRIDALRGISVTGTTLAIGALTRHSDLESSLQIARHAPLIAEAIRHVAHPAIRNRGTMGGSLANADPASELPACALALDAIIVAQGPAGERTLPARDFFLGFYETALAPDEILTRVEIPLRRDEDRFAFGELARRSGDYAMAGLAASAAMNAGTCRSLRLAFFGVGETPVLATRAAEALTGEPDRRALDRAVAALAEDLDPQSDLQASAAMRRHLAGVLLSRAAADLFPESDIPAHREALAS